MNGMRPTPPNDLLGLSRPAPDVESWLRKEFIDPGGALRNPHHAHLEHAKIGVLWTGTEWRRRGARVLGSAELPEGGSMPRWKAVRLAQQLIEWFGTVPDFLLTFDADACANLNEWEWCALVDHELYHCAQAEDQFGAPRFSRTTGQPVWTIRGHDVEEFVGVVQRWGVGVANPALAALVAAADKGPTLKQADVRAACGTCNLKLAG